MIDLNDLEERIAENEKHGLYTSPAVKELIAELREARSEVERLRAIEIEGQDIRPRRYDHLFEKRHAFAEGVSKERADVIEWLTEAQFHVVLREEVGVIAKLKRQFRDGLHVRLPKEAP